MIFKSWSIIYKKGYQETDAVSSSVSSKVKGLGYIKYGSNETYVMNGNLIASENGNIRIFDVRKFD